MTARDLLRLVWSNLSRMRGRAIMTAMGVLIGTAAIVVLIALASGLQESTTSSFSEFGPLNQITVLPSAGARMFGGGDGRNQDARLTRDALDRFRGYAGVVAVSPYISVNASQVSFNRMQGFASLTGIDPREVRDIGFEIERGSDHMGRWTVIAGPRVAENFVDAQGRSIREGELDLFGRTLLLKLERMEEDGTVSHRTIRLRVGGILQERGGQDDTSIYMSLDDADEINTWMSGRRTDYAREGYSQAVVVVDDPGLMLQVENTIVAQGYFAFSARSALQQINIFFAIVQAVFGGIGAIALVVAAIGIANTMVMSILERTREIGLMKAVGATNRDVMSVFLAEAGAIGVLGGIGGVILGIGASKLINLIAVAYINAQVAASGSTSSDPISIVHIPLWLPIFSIIFALIIGLASGIYPALRAVQLDPVAALKYE